MFKCQAIIKQSFCEEAADWIGHWSDRELFVCTEHRDYIRKAHNGDHDYDRTGIWWVSSLGTTEFESRESLLGNSYNA